MKKGQKVVLGSIQEEFFAEKTKIKEKLVLLVNGNKFMEEAKKTYTLSRPL